MTDDDRFWVGPPSAPETYQLISCLGGGAEGEVWTAILPLSAEGRRNVAVKILPGGGTSTDEEAWVRHGHLLRSISHPGLVRVLEVFTGPPRHRVGTVPAGASRYVVMDLIEGLTLREWLDENPAATVSARLRTLTTVASALDEMHSGAQTAVPVAHGDVKPSNIVMRPDGSTVLVDLGLTRLTDGGGKVGRSRPYAAPELFHPEGRTSPEADRFAFAATVVHAVLGEPPPVGAGGGPDLAAVDHRLRTNPISARRPILVNQLMQALAAPPQQRPTNLRAWLGALTDTLSQVTESGGGVGMLPPTLAPADQTATSGFVAPPGPLAPAAAPPAKRGRKRLVAVAASVVAVLVLVSGAVAAYALTRGDNTGSKTGSTAGAGQQTTAPAGTTTTTPAQTDTPTASPSPSTSDDVAAAPGGSASTSPSPQLVEGSAPGVPLSGDDAYAQGFIADYSSMSYQATDIDINGQKLLSGFQSTYCCQGTPVRQSTIDLNLSRKYRTLTGLVGIEDHSQPNVSVRVQVFGDNVVLFDKTVTLGHPQQLRVSVANVLRLRVVFTGQLYIAKTAIGDPTVYA
jgi:hypothetical protein